MLSINENLLEEDPVNKEKRITNQLLLKVLSAAEKIMLGDDE